MTPFHCARDAKCEFFQTVDRATFEPMLNVLSLPTHPEKLCARVDWTLTEASDTIHDEGQCE